MGTIKSIPSHQFYEYLIIITELKKYIYLFILVTLPSNLIVDIFCWLLIPRSPPPNLRRLLRLSPIVLKMTRTGTIPMYECCDMFCFYSTMFSDHFHNTHGKFGLVLTLFVMVQVLAAAYRPPAPKGGVDHMGNQLVRSERAGLGGGWMGGWVDG